MYKTRSRKMQAYAVGDFGKTDLVTARNKKIEPLFVKSKLRSL